MTLQNSTISDFHVTVDGGVIAVTGKGTVTILNSTLSGNTADGNGGALSLTPGSTVLVDNSTLAFNSAATGGGISNNGGTVTLASSIVAKNSATTGQDISGAATANFSLVGNTAGSMLSGANNVLNVDPMLGLLTNNGGPTQTHALMAGSPAINKGSNPNNLQFDQRGPGFFRNAGGSVDIGAFEVQFPVRVTSVTINDGTSQRSRVTSITLAFDQIVNFSGSPETAFDIVRPMDSKHPVFSTAVDNTGAGTVVTFTFSGTTAVDFGSLADGRYTLTILRQSK